MAPKKEKAQKMQLGEFLTDTSFGSWAEEMDEVGIPSPSGRTPYGGGDRGYGSSAMSGGRFDGFSVREQLPLPTRPPYTVHIGNLSFDATEGDVNDLFQDCEVSSVRIVEDKLDSKPKGFGYVEFHSLEGLKKALTLSGTQFQGRNIRISVAEPQKDREQTRDFGDWSRKGPLPDAPNQRKGPDRGFGPRPDRSFDNMSEAGSERGGERGGRRGYEPSDGKMRDFSDWSRKGPSAPVTSNPAPAQNAQRPGSRDGNLLRRNSPASWGEGRSQDSGSRPPRREFVERPHIERAPTAAEQDNQWRARMKPDAPSQSTSPSARSPAQSNRGSSNPPSPAPQPAVPASRPKLNLAKRTVSEAPKDAPAAPATDSKASPFGAARPTDTATREKEVEEKRQIALREKKEADEKAKEEKRVADEKAKEERKLAKEADLAARAAKGDQTPKSPSQVNGNSRNMPDRRKSDTKVKSEKENGATTPSPSTSKPRYEILRRHTGEEGSMIEEETEDPEPGTENGLITGDKEVKPQEIVRDPQAGTITTNGTTTTAPAETTAEALEDEGWSTVAKPQRKGKGGNQAARALAS